MMHFANSMSGQKRLHLVRVGALGDIGAFQSTDGTLYPRGARVVLRTARGLELGEVLTQPDQQPLDWELSGAILRRMTIEDQLLEERLSQNRQRAWQACSRHLVEQGLSTVLMDVEHLFDGRTLVFYFLGPQPAQLDQLMAELAETYDAQVQFRKFAQTLVAGCGPDCGSADSPGGCASCATGCSLQDVCGPVRRTRPSVD